ncbi:ATP-binding cassette sub-family A member 2 [Lamellibrachia satsuma]|nr:ATP-binding cassette sub-family A member 2 [Lamellibrachia satsuma]
MANLVKSNKQISTEVSCIAFIVCLGLIAPSTLVVHRIPQPFSIKIACSCSFLTAMFMALHLIEEFRDTGGTLTLSNINEQVTFEEDSRLPCTWKLSSPAVWAAPSRGTSLFRFLAGAINIDDCRQITRNFRKRKLVLYLRKASDLLNPGISIRNLRKVYGSGNKEYVAVDGMTMTAYEEQITVLLGPNDAGKTTLVEMLTAALPAATQDSTRQVRHKQDSARQAHGYTRQHSPSTKFARQHSSSTPYARQHSPSTPFARQRSPRTPYASQHSINTRFTPPTSGTATIGGYDIQTDMCQVSQIVGFCPHYDPLFEDLTLEENLVFFAMVRGCDSKHAQTDPLSYTYYHNIAACIAELQLSLHRHTKVSAMCAGLKRQLVILLTLVGSPKAIILDEPTRGLDPDTRRNMCDLLKRYRKNRTILLTTQDMEEADILADRVAVLSNGKLLCCGSPEFLKKSLGLGYNLVITAQPSCDPKEVSKLLMECSICATLDRTCAFELSYSMSVDKFDILSLLLSKLEENLDRLHIVSYILSTPSLMGILMR